MTCFVVSIVDKKQRTTLLLYYFTTLLLYYFTACFIGSRVLDESYREKMSRGHRARHSLSNDRAIIGY